MKNLGDFVTDYASGAARRSNFYLFEAWDVEARPDWMKEQAAKDGVTESIDAFGEAPHLFQSGIIYEQPRIGAIFAGTQTGKSYPVGMDLIIQATGELPHAMRYDKGEDTGIKRDITEANIIRFGRFNAETGEFIDKNEKEEIDPSWNCGNIIGTGRYPVSKLLNAGEEIWLGTFKQARDVNWWKFFRANIPEHLLDKTKGRDGFYESTNKGYIIFFNNNITLRIVTYEQGYERFESGWAKRIVLDEEPPDEKIWVSALGHCDYISLVETPYRGITYTFKRIRKAGDSSVRIYHCTQYDSPYRTREEVNRKRLVMPKWEIEARVYGLHSEQRGKPYFHDLYTELKDWVRHFIDLGISYDINIPAVENNEIVGKVASSRRTADGMWNVFEEPNPKYSYIISADTARGDDGGDERVDANVAHVFRCPDPEKGEDLEFPVEVAICRTVKETKIFARECLAAAVWYNNAVIAPESNGFSAGTFISEIHGYPFVYNMTVKDDRTNRRVSRVGFNTNIKTRQQLFDEIGEFLMHNAGKAASPIKSFSTVFEIASLIVGKRGKPDHPRGGTSDSAISFGIGLYIYQHDRSYFKNRAGLRTSRSNGVDTWGGRIVPKDSQKKQVLGRRR